MARIYIEPTKAKRSIQDEADLGRTLSSLSQEVSSIKSNLRYKISGCDQIGERLRQVSEQIAKESTATRALSDGLQQIIARYEQVENSNRDRQVADKTTVQAVNSGAAQNGGGWEPFDWGKLGEKVLEKLLGPFGLVVDLPDVIDGDASDLVKFHLKGIGSIAKVASTTGDTSAEWLGKVFGWTTMKPKSFFEELGQFDTTAHTVGTVANWAGKAVDSFVKNNEEFGGEWCARFWEETAVEAGIKVVEGAAVKAGLSMAVAGICAAAGVACPPTIVVGVAAVGVGMALDWALDGLVSWATNGSCTSWVEGVSDLVCDGVDALREGVGTIVTKTGEAINNVKDAAVEVGKKTVYSISNGIKSVSDGIGNLFGGCRWAGCLFA